MTPPSIPLVRRFPALERVPRKPLGTFPTPVDQLPGDRPLWVKRDDRSTTRYGGNKIRALEYLLGDLRPGESVLTVGGEGSTHALVTAAVARQLGVTMRVIRWAHEMNPEASLVAGRVRAIGAEILPSPGPIRGMVRAWILARRPNVRYIPLGGTAPLGMLGHINAGLELAEQIDAGVLPAPEQVVLPFGTGGTAAGLALGLHLAGVDTRVVAVRVGPRLGSTGLLLRWRLRQAVRTLARLSGERITTPPRRMLSIEHGWSGGAYGRPEPRARKPAEWLKDATGIRLDGTYGAKAFGAAHERAALAGGPVLFWLTFDGRWIEESGGASGELQITGPQAAVRPPSRTPR
ncbi:MAG TPA: pyridoxal-phosphate dependent enzyme [Gemmatimonadaceae bacterium]|nr:pyridoxal-phosphate dependent enzyme [Gemmatimonadaceae bacterium]